MKKNKNSNDKNSKETKKLSKNSNQAKNNETKNKINILYKIIGKSEEKSKQKECSYIVY